MADDILTQDEIEELLSKIANADGSEEETPHTKKIKMYDFKRPDVLSKEHISFTKEIFKLFANKFITTLAKENKKGCRFVEINVDQLTYVEFIRSMPYDAPMFLANSNFGNFIVEADPQIIFCMQDLVSEEDDEAKRKSIDERIEKEYAKELERLTKIYGEEKGRKYADNWKEQREKSKYLNIPYRELSYPEIKRFKTQFQKPFISVLKKTLTKDLKDCYKFNSCIKKWNVKKTRFERYPFFSSLNAPQEMVCLISIDAVFNGIEGFINICIPYKQIIKIINEVRGIKEMESKKSIDMDLVQGTKVPVEVVLGSIDMSLNDVSALNDGSFIELNKLATSPVDIKVNGKIVGHGEVVVIDDNFGVRLTDFEGSDEKPADKTDKTEE